MRRHYDHAISGFHALTVAWFVVAGSGMLCGQDPDSTWENARPGVNYVGTQACVECHKEQHASYLQTTHSVATMRTDPDQEAASTVFVHPVLGYQYEVERKDGSLIHRETIPAADGETLISTERAIDLTIGSGQHAKSYLFREGPYFGQSPLTWYEAPNAWRMSPGYEGAYQPSFRRKIRSECVFCHVGSIDVKEMNPYQFEVLELTIGCERCHGPGELHVAKYRNNPAPSIDDRTIVNPANLPRELGEAVCQQCHLQGANWVTTSGKDYWNFRPGLPITDFRVDYQLTEGSGSMRIVGHVEQMHASECYKQSETLTCTTCHDPHHPVPQAERVDYQRSVCLNCHKDESCGVSHEQRMREADNSCFECHMPKADTNVAHAAFHHHQIGIHSKDAPSPPKKVGQQIELVPVLDLSGLSERERIRCGALAKAIHLRGDPENPDYDHFGYEATEELIKLKSMGPVDADCDSQLALLAIAQQQPEIAEKLAKEALVKEPRPTLAHIEARALLGRIAFQSGRHAEAVEQYRAVNKLHLDDTDMFYLGLCESNVGNVQAAIAALKRSLEINPLQVGPHHALEAIYTANKQEGNAAYHAEMKQKISAELQRIHELGAAQKR